MDGKKGSNGGGGSLLCSSGVRPTRTSEMAQYVRLLHKVLKVNGFRAGKRGRTLPYPIREVEPSQWAPLRPSLHQSHATNLDPRSQSGCEGLL
jgi:hypothetical protein